jgi:hypothetical protein
MLTTKRRPLVPTSHYPIAECPEIWSPLRINSETSL